MGLMNDVKAPAEKAGLRFSVMGAIGWVIGAILLVLLFIYIIIPVAKGIGNKVSGSTKTTAAGTTAPSSGSLTNALADIGSFKF